MCAEQHPELSSGYFSISSLQLEVPEIVNEIKFWFLYPSFFIDSSFSYEIEVIN
jgi:hypothetical protein